MNSGLSMTPKDFNKINLENSLHVNLLKHYYNFTKISLHFLFVKFDNLYIF